MAIDTSVDRDASKNYDGTVRSDKYGVFYQTGKLMTPGTTEVRVYRVDNNDKVLEAEGETVPAGEAGYAKGAVFRDTNLSGANVYVNEGDDTTASWAISTVKDNGSQAVGYFDITGITADTQSVDIGGRTYEFDTDSSITGDVAVDISGGASATDSATALAAAINGDSERTVDAIDNGDGTVLLVRSSEDATMPALDASGAANVVASGAAMVLGAAEAITIQHKAVRTITAQDVTTTTDTNGSVPVAAIPATSAPSAYLVQVRDSNGTLKAMANTRFSWVQANSNYYVLKALETQNGSTDFAASDTVTVLVFQ